MVCRSQADDNYNLLEHLARSTYFGDDWGQIRMIMLSSYYDRSEHPTIPHILSVLSDHPKPAIYDHLKTGHMETPSGTLTAA